MTDALPHHDRVLLEAAAAADIIAVAGRMIANPWRARLSLAEVLAMSIGLEQVQPVLIETRLLLAALDLPETGNPHDAAVKAHAIQRQTDSLRAALAVLDGTTTHEEETNHG